MSASGRRKHGIPAIATHDLAADDVAPDEQLPRAETARERLP